MRTTRNASKNATPKKAVKGVTPTKAVGIEEEKAPKSEDAIDDKASTYDKIQCYTYSRYSVPNLSCRAIS